MSPTGAPGFAARLRRLTRRGPAYGLYLIRGVALPRLGHRLLAALGLERRSRRWTVGTLATVLAAGAGFAAAGELGAVAGAVLLVGGWGLAVILRRYRQAREVKALLADRDLERVEAARLDEVAPRAPSPGDGDIPLGEIDNDGRLGHAAVALDGIPTVSDGRFAARYRYDLGLRARRGRLLLVKDYRGDRAALRREAAALARLAGSGLAPELLAVDRRAARLEKTWIHGPTLRDLMVAAGARILSEETEHEAELAALPRQQRLERVWERGRRVLPAVAASSKHDVPDDLVGALERALTGVHRRGVTGPSLTFGNIVLRQPGGQPVLLDFDAARCHRRAAGPAFDLARDRDRRLLGRIYGAEIETEASVRRALAGPLATSYAPLDLGRGLVTRGFWSVDSGTGRWEYLNRDALGEVIRDARVLDLGAHNAALSLMMLVDGARAVTAVERDPERVAAARRLHRILEWRDMRSYDLEVRLDDMRAVLEEDWGRFDVVTAFCSLYYLPEEDMRRVLVRATEIAPRLVLQAKTDTRPEAADDKARKSSPEFLAALAQESGWAIERMHTRPGFTRPLLVAVRESGP